MLCADTKQMISKTKHFHKTNYIPNSWIKFNSVDVSFCIIVLMESIFVMKPKLIQNTQHTHTQSMTNSVQFYNYKKRSLLFKYQVPSTIHTIHLKSIVLFCLEYLCIGSIVLNENGPETGSQNCIISYYATIEGPSLSHLKWNIWLDPDCIQTESNCFTFHMITMFSTKSF